MTKSATMHNSPFLILPFSSDGMSRTGVFITCMSEIERVKVEGAVDIFQTVKAARAQRPHMVYTSVSTTFNPALISTACAFQSHVITKAFHLYSIILAYGKTRNSGIATGMGMRRICGIWEMATKTQCNRGAVVIVLKQVLHSWSPNHCHCQSPG